ncbi:replication initiator protein A [Anaerovoracaceae bacterium 42-11]
MKTRYATYTGNCTNVFYRVPVVLLDSAAYPDLTIEGILVYGLLLDRMSLSVTHVDRFADDKGRIFIIFTIDDIAAALNLKRKKVMNLLKSLEDAGLIAREKSPGMNNTTRIYVKNFAAPFSQASGDDAFPYFYTNEQADIHSFIQVPFSMLKDPVLSDLTLEEIFLYCLLHDRLRLSMNNRESFSDENGVYIFFGIESIMSKMRVGRRKAIDMLSALDEKNGIGLVKKERAGGWSNKNKLYIKKYVPSEELLLMLEKDSSEKIPDKNTTKKIQKGRSQYHGTKANKRLKPLKFKKVRFVHYRKSDLCTIESPDFALSKVQFVHYRKSDLCTIESPDFASSKVPISHPNQTNINHTNKNIFTEENSKKKSHRIKSRSSVDYENDIDKDFSFKISFSDSFAEAIELHNILPDPSLAESWIKVEEAKKERDFRQSIYSEVVRAMEFEDRSYKVDGITYTVNQLKKELLSLDPLMFMEACDRIRHTKKEVRHWDKYIITVLMQVKRTFVLSQQNKISVFEGKLEKKD